MCPSWMRSVACAGTTRHSPHVSRSRPPSRPVRPTVSAPRALAASTASSTLGELPLVLMATSTSPGRTIASTWRLNTVAKS
jgi:hypothetical protein